MTCFSSMRKISYFGHCTEMKCRLDTCGVLANFFRQYSKLLSNYEAPIDSSLALANLGVKRMQ